MNLLISILLSLLLVIFSLPITPKEIYFYYLQKKGKIKEDQQLEHYRKLILNISIILLIFFVAMSIIGIFTGWRAIDFMFAFALPLPIKLFFFLLFNYNFEVDFPEKVKKFNLISNIVIFTICVVIVTFGVATNNKIQDSIPKTIPEFIVNYATDNNYTIMPENHINLIDSGITKKRYFVNSTSTHQFFIDTEDNKVVAYNKETPSESFEAKYDTLHKIDRNDLEKKYSNILDNLYLGANYTPIYYLLNEDEILLLYGLFEKDENTSDFYISKYVLFNMTKDKLTELQLEENKTNIN